MILREKIVTIDVEDIHRDAGAVILRRCGRR